MKKIIKTAALCCMGIFLFKGNYANAQVVSDTFKFSNTIVRFVVPNGVTSITIQAQGAQGGDGNYQGFSPGGHGANLTGTFTVTSGNVLEILAGQKPAQDSNNGGANGGGGGSFVWDSTNSNNLLMAAGGGGGSCHYNPLPPNGADADLADSGTMGTYDDVNYADSSAPGGRSGNGGNAKWEGAGGAGWLTNGQNGTGFCSQTFGGQTPLNGGQGGIGTANNGGFGGGGGAGSCWWSGGGGGGYSGGSGSGGTEGGGGGGGSFNGGTSQTNFVTSDTGNGWVVISYNTPTGINDINWAAKISIYPNPNNGHFTIYGIAKGDVVKVYNYLGEEVSNKVAGNSDNIKYDISGEASGIYLVKIQNAAGKLITERKVIKAQ